MKKLFVLMSLFIIAIINSGCPKPCIQANYSFAISSKITPDIDTIHIGDTLFLISSFPSSLQDQASGVTIDYSNAQNLGSTLGVSQFINGNKIPNDAVFNFNYLSIKGKVYNDRNIPSPDGIQQLTYEAVNGNYELKIGLIPKIKGVYGLGVGDGISNGRNKGRNCEKAAFNISLNMVNQHFYIYMDLDSGHQVTNYEHKHAYYFVVN